MNRMEASNATKAVFAVLARLITILAERGIIDRADVLELIEIAKRHMER